MGKIFICSDTHFGHIQPFLFEPRGFTSVQEHDTEVIRRWNEVVSPEDEVYHLGDVMMNDNENGMNCLRQLNGKIHIIRGNHCTNAKVALYETLENVDVIGYADVIKYRKYNFYLSHHPTITSNLDADKPLKARLINLCGHTHTQDKFADWDKGIIYHCEMDAHNCYPILLDTIIEEIKEKLVSEETPN